MSAVDACSAAGDELASVPLGVPVERVVFLGTPADAVPSLRALCDAGIAVVRVVTAPPARRSRRGAPTPTPVELAARELGLDVSYHIDAVLEHVPDDAAPVCGVPACGVVVAFGQLISARVLRQLPMVNLHFSLLPRWRGAAPVERALLAGDATTGVSLMALAEALDVGPVYWSHEVRIQPRDTAVGLRARLANIGADRLAASLTQGLGEPVAQRDEPTYARKITRDDRKINWNVPAEQVDRLIRVGDAWTTIGGRELKVHEAVPVDSAFGVDAATGRAEAGQLVGNVVVCATGALRLEVVQPASKPKMDADDWRRGARLDATSQLGA